MVMQHRWILATLVVALLIHVASCVTCWKCQTDGLNCPNDGDTCLEAECYQLANNGTVKRGCTSELTVKEDKDRCSSLTDMSCTTCKADKCNGEKLLKCYTCVGCDDEQKDATNLKSCPAFQDQCYSKVADGKVQRGCLSEIKDFAKECDKQSCKICNKDSCNKQSKEKIPELLQCLRCTSDDPLCESGLAQGLTCDGEEKSCFSSVEGNKLTRDCLTDATKCKTGDATCVTCNSSSNCNTVRWQKCHQCTSGDAECDLAQAAPAKQPSFCKQYKAADLCYERLLDNKIQRGCESDAADAACKDNAQCRTCDRIGCNSNALNTLKTNFRCLRCDTMIDKSGTCLMGTLASQPCLEENTQCYSAVNEAGELWRGCMKEFTGTLCNGTLCSPCNSTSCNNGTFPTDRLRCYQCSTSDGDKTCADALTGESKSAFCKIYKTTDQCYTRIRDGVLERGCESTLGKDANACQGLNEKECRQCTGENCNAVSEDRLKNFADRAVVNHLLVVFTPVLLTLAALR